MIRISTEGPASLDEVLAYRHPGVLRRYAKDYHASPIEAEEVFREMLKMLYLCSLAPTDGPEVSGFAVSTEIEKLDWMWHTFLLFTRDYAEFCERHFGSFIDHLPSEADDDDSRDGATVDHDGLRSRIERNLTMVYDVLGEATLTAWYDQCRYAAPT
jgi:hypothetical protein